MEVEKVGGKETYNKTHVLAGLCGWQGGGDGGREG